MQPAKLSWKVFRKYMLINTLLIPHNQILLLANMEKGAAKLLMNQNIHNLLSLILKDLTELLPLSKLH